MYKIDRFKIYVYIIGTLVESSVIVIFLEGEHICFLISYGDLSKKEFAVHLGSFTDLVIFILAYSQRWEHFKV